ncbi:MAG: glycogen synthase GlgA [Rhizomicrobium sp.]|jgi:starch synthase
MRVLFVTAEAYPLAKTGGLADVSRALPIALMGRGVDVHLLVPGYPSAFTRVEKPRFVAKLDPILGVSDGMLVSGTVPDTELPVWLVDAPSLYRRTGSLYQDENGQEWPDNALRFAYLSHVANKLAMGRTKLAWRPDVVHANDWHAGLLPLLLSLEKAPRPHSVFTTHNMAFQGNFPATALPIVDVPDDDFTTNGFEFYGQVSFLKAGLRYADRVTTVSPNYAKEILTAEFGCGMEGVLQARAGNFSGILNGIDDTLWNPATDYHIPQNYRASDISGKRVCKTALQRELGLPVSPETPLIGFVSRFTHQKMADVILQAIPWIIEQGAQFALVGEGDPVIEAAFAEVQAAGNRENLSVTVGYDEPLAHRLQAGSDILLAPARFEPCGLTQLYGLRYGSLPVVRRTGGLADTVVNTDSSTLANRTATGFVFEEPDLTSLVEAIGRALALYAEPLTWRRLQLQAMAQNFSWDASAEKYLALYHAASGIPQLQSAEGVQAGQVPERQAAIGAV